MNDQSLTAVPMQSMSVTEVRAQATLIQDLMKAVMVEDTHYGKIPGCGDKPALFKPGAEKICLIFGLVPSFDIQVKELPGGHREYETTCTLTHRQTGQVVGQGVGVCSTMESKYRYRWDNTGKPVPKEYWDTRNPDLLGGPAFAARKQWVDGKQVWLIFQKTEHSDPADYYNTAKKISKKRGHIDAAITSTAASDCFTPIAEDDVDTYVDPDEGTTPAGGTPKKEETPKPQRKTNGAAAGATNGNKWRGIIARVDIKKKGTNAKGPYTIYTITGKDGTTFDTFSDTDAEICSASSSNDAEVVIVFESDAYGKKIKTVEPVLEGRREPGQEG